MSSSSSLDQLRAVIARHWGYNSFRPLQREAMEAVLSGRDSIVVLPTGGGKSLCYQAPAVVRGELAVVVSPLIALMKDQVDSLIACGIPAGRMDSSQSFAARNAVETQLMAGELRLLFISPERLVMPEFAQLLQRLNVRTFAVDEAHCISHWGHDFRPEYRQLNHLREAFPEASLHAYTATATEQVRRDIITQLRLREPAVLVGNFDRPNLTYRVLPRFELFRQVREVLDRHSGEPGIIYCIRRRDVDELTEQLKSIGHSALPYHAGMSPDDRRASQDAFAAEECNLIVATIAFGMGIDRSNLRFIIHTGMPKSLEHYQQETGRAGRDGLEAECILLHSGQDFLTWKRLMERSAQDEPGADAAYLTNALKHLNDMDRYCRGGACRHRALVEYFGQRYTKDKCGACDLCLGDTEPVPEGQVIAQKILSCVARVKESFGVNHVVGVLRGEKTDNIRRRGHDTLSTHGLLKEHDKSTIREWIYQLISQQCLAQEGGEYPLLKLTTGSWEIMRNQRTIRLIQPIRHRGGEKPAKSEAEAISWEGVDRTLYDALRELRRGIAQERRLQPYLIFSDATLRELARVRPSSLEGMRMVYGIGEAKLRDHGERFFEFLDDWSREHGLARDQAAGVARRTVEVRADGARRAQTKRLAFDLFRRGTPLADVMRRLDRKLSTVSEYLCEYILEERPASIKAWIAPAIYERIRAAAQQHGLDRLKPLYVALGEQVDYELLRIAAAHLRGTQEQESSDGGVR